MLTIVQVMIYCWKIGEKTVNKTLLVTGQSLHVLAENNHALSKSIVIFQTKMGPKEKRAFYKITSVDSNENRYFRT